ncbi:MAG: glycerol acyltransferase, partial [Hydrogenophaga sp.]|nr:glycerol acyltransferase [Hydrogenophaga sp.]
GIAKILVRANAEGLQVPVIPMALTHLWGSYFSRIERAQGEPTAMVKPFRRGLFNRVGLNVGAPVMAEDATPDGLRERVAGLMQ